MEFVDQKKIAHAVKQGFDRSKAYRRARAMYIMAYVGKYYSKLSGMKGDEPINLAFHAIKAMVPNLVMKSPVNKVGTNILPYEDYAFLLSEALNWLDSELDFKKVLRYGIVDAMFGLAVFKTGIAQSGNIINFDDVKVDTGQIYTDNVSIDDYVFDPSCRSLDKIYFEGDRNRIPRILLLDDDSYDHDLIMQLPSSVHPNVNKKAEALTQSNLSNSEIYELQDFVDVVELFVPDANAIVVMADPEQTILDDYLAVKEYYGPTEGPYTKMALTQPVPDNPFPIAPMGIWFDMHHIANKYMAKTMRKADRQKDIAIYDPMGADEAEDIRTSQDGDMIQGNPDTVKVVSFGGAKAEDIGTMSALREWYNYMAGNPDQMTGQSVGAKTATGQSILQGNMSTGIEDMRDIVYDTAAKLNKKMAWFLHTDPFIELPFIYRKPGGERTQLILTPEQRRGDFLDFNFTIKQRSMTRLDPAVRAKRIADFTTNGLTSIANTAMIFTQMGIPFNAMKATTDLADEMGILEEVTDWFSDPDFMQRIQLMMVMGPQNPGRAGQQGPVSNAGIVQNNGSPIRRNVASPQTEFNKNAQMGANQGAY